MAGMFYNQVKWLEIRAILSNLVLRPPSLPPSPAWLSDFLPSSFSVYLLSKLIRLISLLDTCLFSRRGKVIQDPLSPVYGKPSP